MREIEILADGESGVPRVILSGEAQKAADERGIEKILVSLSHSEVRVSLFVLLMNES